MAEQKLALSLDALIAQAGKKKDRKPLPRQAAVQAQAPQSGPRKGLNKNRQKNNVNANGAAQPRPPKQQQQQQQPQQQQQQQQPRQSPGGQRNRRGGAPNLGVRGGQVQKRSVIEVPVKVLRAPMQVPVAPLPQRVPRGYQQRQSAPDGKWQHDLYVDDYVPTRRAPVSQVTATSNKLIVKNLHHQVSTDDLLELFSTCGTVKSHGVNYDTSGRSVGTGWVVFETRKEAELAKKEYNLVKLDGQAMEIRFPEELSNAPLKKLSSGIVVQKPAAGGSGGGGSGGGGGAAPVRERNGGQRLAAAAIRETAAASRGTGRMGGQQRGGRLRSAVVGRAQLDSDLQDYMQE